MENAKWFHEAECPILDCLYLENADGSSLSGITTIYRTIQKISRAEYLLSHGIDSDLFRSGQLPVCETTETSYDPDDYRNVHRLETHTAATLQSSPPDAFRNALWSVFIVKILLRTHLKQQFVDGLTEAALGSIVLRNVQISGVNNVDVEDVVQKRGFKLSMSQIGVALYTTLSLVNSSCNPNALRIRFGDTLVLFAAYPVRAGEEVTTLYFEVFANAPKPERQLKLKDDYFFDCRCVACVENWPLAQSLMRMPEKYRCPKCPYKGLVPAQPKCPSCGEGLARMWTVDQAHRTEYINVRTKLLGAECSPEAFEVLVKFFVYIDKMVLRPSKVHLECYSILMGRLYALGTKRMDRG